MPVLNRRGNRRRESFGEHKKVHFSLGPFELETSVGHKKSERYPKFMQPLETCVRVPDG